MILNFSAFEGKNIFKFAKYEIKEISEDVTQIFYYRISDDCLARKVTLSKDENGEIQTDIEKILDIKICVMIYCFIVFIQETIDLENNYEYLTNKKRKECILNWEKMY